MKHMPFHQVIRHSQPSFIPIVLGVRRTSYSSFRLMTYADAQRPSTKYFHFPTPDMTTPVQVLVLHFSCSSLSAQNLLRVHHSIWKVLSTRNSAQVPYNLDPSLPDLQEIPNYHNCLFHLRLY